MSRPALVGIATATATVIAACAERGGDPRFDAEAPVALCFDEQAPHAGGTTFTDLYRDFFGPGAHSACAGDGNCHGSPSEPGAQGAKFVCPADKATCYGSLTGESGLVQRESDPAAPENSALVTILRRMSPDADGKVIEGGGMPRRPACAFSVQSIERIESWIRAGARND